MEFAPFSIARLPRIIFGEGRVVELADIVVRYGSRVLLVVGGRSFREGDHWTRLTEALGARGVSYERFSVTGEPSPQLVDDAVKHYHGAGIEVVLGIGGGSVLDAAKAIAGLLRSGNSVLDYLEDVGKGLEYEEQPLPMIAVPTTAGTGSEATKNAVLSEHGPGGYKKSFRHESLVPQVALVDPLLLRTCPAPLIAAQGMDAFTQLLESYVSLRANPFTDALAWSGLEAVKDGFLAAWEGGDTESARRGRASMCYAALVSGITLAQVGLGSVHGLAQPLGSLFPIPHGVACGTTVAEATAVNLEALRERLPHAAALKKYARAGRLLSGRQIADDEEAGEALVEVLREWTERLGLPRLGHYGVGEKDVAAIVANSRGSSMKSNPVTLTDEEIAAVVRRRL